MKRERFEYFSIEYFIYWNSALSKFPLEIVNVLPSDVRYAECFRYYSRITPCARYDYLSVPDILYKSSQIFTDWIIDLPFHWFTFEKIFSLLNQLIFTVISIIFHCSNQWKLTDLTVKIFFREWISEKANHWFNQWKLDWFRFREYMVFFSWFCSETLLYMYQDFQFYWNMSQYID